MKTISCYALCLFLVTTAAGAGNWGPDDVVPSPVAPSTLTVSSPCLAYKCGEDGLVAKGKSITAYENYLDKKTRIVIPGNTKFKYINTVSITTKPGIAIVEKTFYEPLTKLRFDKGSKVLLYADWGEGCYTVWSKGILFGFQNTTSMQRKNTINCIFSDSLKTTSLGKEIKWTLIKFTLGGKMKQAYFNLADPVNNEVIGFDVVL